MSGTPFITDTVKMIVSLELLKLRARTKANTKGNGRRGVENRKHGKGALK